MANNTPMTQDEQVQLTPQDVRSALRRFEKETGLSEKEFTLLLATESSLPAEITEEEAAEWEYLLQLRAEIESYDAECRKEYLSFIDDSEIPETGTRNPNALAA